MQNEITCALAASPMEPSSLGDPAEARILAELGQHLSATAGLMSRSLLTTLDVARSLTGLSALLSTNLSFMRESWDVRTDEVALTDTLDPALLGLEPGSAFDNLVDVLVRYDNYFGTHRTASWTPSRFGMQLAETAAMVVDDLAYCTLESNETRAILEALSAAIETIAPTDVAFEESSVLVSGTQEPLKLTAETHLDDVDAAVVYRWKLGHHLFNLLTVATTSSLTRAMQHLHDEQVFSDSLHSAATTFRGTTAAMWYAEACPRDLYVGTIRPSMIAASGTGTGFSGTDNLEFRWFKHVSSRLIDTTEATFGNPAGWPELVWDSVWHFLETRQLDMEHHTLLAEKVVGIEPSLKQARIIEKTGGQVDERPAVDALRFLGTLAANEKERIF